MTGFALVACGLAALFASVDITGEGTCPDPVRTQAALNALVQSSEGAERLVLRLVERPPSAVEARLETEDGRLLAEREIESPSCASRASAVAVFAATWLAQAGLALPPHAPPPPPPPSPPPAPPPPPKPAPPPPRPTWSVSLGGQLLAAWAPGAGAGPGGGAWVDLGPEASLRFRADALVLPEHDVDVGSGQAGWRRLTAGIGLAAPFAVWAETQLALEVTGRLAHTRVRGQGFPAVREANGLVPGVGAAVVATWLRRGVLRPAVALSALTWLADERAQVETPSGLASARLARFQLALELRVGLGL